MYLANSVIQPSNNRGLASPPRTNFVDLGLNNTMFNALHFIEFRYLVKHLLRCSIRLSWLHLQNRIKQAKVYRKFIHLIESVLLPIC